MKLQNARFVFVIWIVLFAVFIFALANASADAIVQSLASLVGGAIAAVAAIIAVSEQFKRQDAHRQEQEYRIRRVLRDELTPFSGKAGMIWAHHLSLYEKSRPHFGKTIDVLRVIPESWAFPPAAAQALRQFDPSFEVREAKLQAMQVKYHTALSHMRKCASRDALYDKSPPGRHELEAYDSFLLAIADYAAVLRHLELDLAQDSEVSSRAVMHEVVFEKAARLWGENNPNSFFFSEEASRAQLQPRPWAGKQ